MKRMPIMFAAMVPLLATAAPAEQDRNAYKQLSNDVPVTEVLGAEVQNREGKEIGEVEDVIFGRDGQVESVLVDRFITERREIVEQEIIGSNMDYRGEGREFAGVWGQQDTDRMQRLSSTEWVREDQKAIPRIGLRRDRNMEQTAGYRQGDEQGPRNPHFAWEDSDGEFVSTLTEIEWNRTTFDDSKDILRADVDERAMQQASYSENEDFTSRGEVKASEVIGTDVNLLDDDSFGEVEEVLLDAETNRASAYVVDTMDYFDEKTYALPANFDATSVFQDEVNYQFTTDEVKQLGEFSLNEDRR